MAYYPGIPTIRTNIIKKDGKNITQIWKNNRIIDEVPTDPSQIRTREENCLWKPLKRGE